MQLIVLAKQNGDTGEMIFRTMSELAAKLACDDKTLRKCLEKFAELDLVHAIVSPECTVRIILPTYYFWQYLRKGGAPLKREGGKRVRNEDLERFPSQQNRTKQNSTGGTSDDMRETVEKIAAEFNSICVSLSPVKTVTEERRRLLFEAIAQGMAPQDWTSLFERVESSDFLTGRTEGKWRASFDWLLNEDNRIKVLEGQYDGTSSSGGPGLKATEVHELDPITLEEQRMIDSAWGDSTGRSGSEEGRAKGAA